MGLCPSVGKSQLPWTRSMCGSAIDQGSCVPETGLVIEGRNAITLSIFKPILPSEPVRVLATGPDRFRSRRRNAELLIHQPSHLDISLPHLYSHFIKFQHPQSVVNRNSQRLIRIASTPSIRVDHHTSIAYPFATISGVYMSHAAETDDLAFDNTNEAQPCERVCKICP